MPIPRRALFWFILWIAWFITLWTLSGQPMKGPKIPPFPYYDKLLHFGYFFGGAGLLSASLFLRNALRPLPWSTLHLIVIVTLTLVGAIDEWHQSWYPFRSGNDAADLTADFLGALTGTFVFRFLQTIVFPKRQKYR